MRPSYRHASLLKALRSLAMRGFRASPGGKMARLKPETYYLPAPKRTALPFLALFLAASRISTTIMLFSREESA